MMRTLLAITLTALALTACAPTSGTADPNLSSAPSNPAKAGVKAKPKSDLIAVTYKITGTAGHADLTYATASGQEQQSGARLPWRKMFNVKRGDFTALYLSAQNSASGAVTCEIDVDGKAVKAAKSSGQFAIVTCDHTLGL